MYEGENTRSTFFRDLIVKILLVLLFIFLLMWLFPMPNLSPFYDKIFTQNVKLMTDAAKSYYTIERLPEEEGETKRLSLQDMLDNKMILEFTDSDGNKCDTEKSYVEVTKKGNEYIYKTNLSCSNNEDYVIEYFGCYDVCEGNNCQKNVTEYQYFKNVSQNYIDSYVCSDGYTLSGSSCISKSSKEVVKEVVATCPSGYTLKNNKCVKTVTEESNATATCPSGYTLKDNKCVKQVQTNATATCPSGYTLKDNKCVKDSITTDANVLYTCPNGYTLSNNKCIKNSIDTISATLVSNCPSGYTKNGNTCYKEVANTSYYCSEGTLSGSNCIITKSCTNTCSKSCTNECGAWICKNVSYNRAMDTSSSATFTRKFVSQLGNTITYYECSRNCGDVCTNKCSCTGGGTTTVAAKSTTTYNTIYANPTNTYTCPSGYTLNGSSCTKNVSDEINATAKYSCTTGTLNGNKCYISGESKTPTYSCTTGTLSGTKCITSDTSTNPVYTCKIGTLSGTKCVIKTTDSKNPTNTCESGYTLKDNKCYKTEVVEDVISATAIYKSRTVKTYMWSTETELSGWSRTGETRVKSISA